MSKDGIEYEQTPINKPNITHKSVAFKSLDRIGTGSILWYLVKRHKFAIVTTWAVVITVFYLLPFLPDLLLHSL